MRKIFATLNFALGFAVAFALFVGIDIYLFDHYEKMWGKGISFQVSLWLVGVGAAIAALSFGLGVTVFKFVPRKTFSFASGILFAGVVWGAAWFGEYLSAPTGLLRITLSVVMVAGGFACPCILALVNKCGKVSP